MLIVSVHLDGQSHRGDYPDIARLIEQQAQIDARGHKARSRTEAKKTARKAAQKLKSRLVVEDAEPTGIVDAEVLHAHVFKDLRDAYSKSFTDAAVEAPTEDRSMADEAAMRAAEELLMQ